MSRKPSTILTVGHGAATLEDFLALLQRAGVAVLVDVRTSPYSRWRPHFNRPELAHAVTEAGMTYLWRGANLGGLGANVHFEQTVREVTDLARKQTVALMCSEKSPEKCHRKTLLTPAFQHSGLQVEHLLHDGTLSRAERHPLPAPTLW